MVIHKSIFIGVLLLLGLTPVFAHASESVQRNQPVRLFLDQTTQAKGFTLASQDHDFYFGVPANSLPVRDRIRVTLKRRQHIPTKIKQHSDTALLSRIYSFDVFNQETVWPSQALWLKVHYRDVDESKTLTLAYWDDNQNAWELLASKQDKTTHTVSASATFPYALIAVIEAPASEVYESGAASWYDYPYAAHKTLPFGTKLKVTNTNNGESVMVEVRDRGPFIEGRIIDLPMTAFEQIASLSSGVISVTIEIVE